MNKINDRNFIFAKDNGDGRYIFELSVSEEILLAIYYDDEAQWKSDIKEIKSGAVPSEEGWAAGGFEHSYGGFEVPGESEFDEPKWQEHTLQSYWDSLEFDGVGMTVVDIDDL